MRRSIAMAAGLFLAVGSATLAGADAEKGTLSGGMRQTESRGGYTGSAGPEYGKDPRQLMPSENPEKGMPGEKSLPGERGVSASASPGYTSPQCDKDPRQLMPSENPLKGMHVKC